MANIFNLGNNNFQVWANAVFQTLDAKDGKADGEISASIWNDFADKVGGKHINEYITEQNAVKSINAYIKRGGEIVKQAIYDYLGWSTDKAHDRMNNAEKMLEEVAIDPTQAQITEAEDSRVGGTWKKATLSDGRYIAASYDNRGQINEITVSTDVKTDEIRCADINDAGDFAEVNFDSSGAHVDSETTLIKNGKYDLKVTDGYEFEKYKVLAEKIFGSYND